MEGKIIFNFQFNNVLLRFLDSNYMESKDEDFLKFYDSFQRNGGKLHIIKQSIPVEQQIEYMLYSFHLRKKRRKKLNENDYNQFFEKLESIDFSIIEKKKILSMLASSSEIRAYRLLEKFAQKPGEELIYWASMALMESRMTIETELSDEKQLYVATGLGGKDEKFRFYVLILSSQKEPFADYQRKVIEKEFEYVFQEYDCEIERLTIYDSYVELVFLIPIVVNIHKTLDKVVLECNQYGNFLFKKYVVTNVRELSQDDVNQILNKYRKSKRKVIKKP